MWTLMRLPTVDLDEAANVDIDEAAKVAIDEAAKVDLDETANVAIDEAVNGDDHEGSVTSLDDSSEDDVGFVLQ